MPVAGTSLTIPTPQKPRRIELAMFAKDSHEENIAYDANILPGMLIQLNNNAGVITVQRHSTVGGVAVRRFATEEALVSRNDPAQSGGIANVDTAYASGALVSSLIARAGDRVAALLKAGVKYSVGDQLISDGAGRLEKASGNTSGSTFHSIIAEVDEFGGGVDLSSTGAVDTRCSVRVF
jgi:hypothetical protein